MVQKSNSAVHLIADDNGRGLVAKFFQNADFFHIVLQNNRDKNDSGKYIYHVKQGIVGGGQVESHDACVGGHLGSQRSERHAELRHSENTITFSAHCVPAQLHTVGHADSCGYRCWFVGVNEPASTREIPIAESVTGQPAVCVELGIAPLPDLRQ
jgi:hypothetical protein